MMLQVMWIAEGIKMEYGAKNQLPGIVRNIERGTDMSQVNLDIPARSPMSSVMTIEALDDLGINEGDQVRVVVKTVNVLPVKQ